MALYGSYSARCAALTQPIISLVPTRPITVENLEGNLGKAHIIRPMIPRIGFLMMGLLLTCGISSAQIDESHFPKRVIFTWSTFIDDGPQFFYNVDEVVSSGKGLSVGDASVSLGVGPHGVPSVTAQSATIQEPMSKFLQNRNPCEIPQKSLRREQDALNNCGFVYLSSATVTLHFTCGGQERQLQMEMLDPEACQPAPLPAPYTTWIRSMTGEMQNALKAGQAAAVPSDAASTNAEVSKRNALCKAFLQSLEDGELDKYFDTKRPLSQVVRRALVSVDSKSPACITKN